MSLKNLFYGKSYQRYELYDVVLGIFQGADFISREQLDKIEKPYGDQIFSFFKIDGIITIEPNGIRITPKGRALISTGGYMKKLLKQRIISLGCYWWWCNCLSPQEAF